MSGSKGSIDIRPIENEIKVTYSDLEIADTPYGDRKKVLDIQDIAPENRYDDMVQEFYDCIVNGKEIALDSPAFIENNRTYLPVRFIVENLGAKVEWVAETRQIIVTK